MAKKNRAQLEAALKALNVPEDEYKNLPQNSDLEQLIKDTKAERAMQAAEGGEDTDAGTDGDTDAGTDGDTPDDDTPDDDEVLTKMVARSGFEVTVVDCAVQDGRRLKKGDKLKVKAEGKFYAGEKTRDHLLDYRAADRA